MCCKACYYFLNMFISVFLFNKTEANKTSTRKVGGKKYLKEPFIHAYANLHSTHTNKEEDANIETHALGSKLAETKRTVGFCEERISHEGFL